ncbi:MAG TPA: hypothetical protein VHY84_15050 [Bryobacteraceae bacterium]|jgi:hypothetical protein|nr:hypothetical protein [Bryobacteraceae bacterium]
MRSVNGGVRLQRLRPLVDGISESDLRIGTEGREAIRPKHRPNALGTIAVSTHRIDGLVSMSRFFTPIATVGSKYVLAQWIADAPDSHQLKKSYAGFREERTMNRILSAGAILAAFAFSAAAQDWYHEREERYRGDQWRPHLFMHVRTDLEHVWSGRAANREQTRLVKTEEELTKMQGDLDRGRWDNGILNDVIDSIRKSSDDDRLQPRDRDVLADDLNRLKEFQDQHNHRH